MLFQESILSSKGPLKVLNVIAWVMVMCSSRRDMYSSTPFRTLVPASKGRETWMGWSCVSSHERRATRVAGFYREEAASKTHGAEHMGRDARGRIHGVPPWGETSRGMFRGNVLAEMSPTTEYYD